jgi:hypothetical protein
MAMVNGFSFAGTFMAGYAAPQPMQMVATSDGDHEVVDRYLEAIRTAE